MAKRRRIIGLAIPSPRPVDAEDMLAIVGLHPYLRCYWCAVPLCEGVTMTGAGVLACWECRRVVDLRRVA